MPQELRLFHLLKKIQWTFILFLIILITLDLIYVEGSLVWVLPEITFLNGVSYSILAISKASIFTHLPTRWRPICCLLFLTLNVLVVVTWGVCVCVCVGGVFLQQHVSFLYVVSSLASCHGLWSQATWL